MTGDRREGREERGHEGEYPPDVLNGCTHGNRGTWVKDPCPLPQSFSTPTVEGEKGQEVTGTRGDSCNHDAPYPRSGST